jgi:hypothetical protein
MEPFRLAAAMLTASLLMRPALGGEFTTHYFLEPPPGALQPCRAGMLLTLPAAWQSGDGAVVLLTTERRGDPLHDALVAALLFEEHAAVLELGAVRCGGTSEGQDGMVAGATDALAAMTRLIGSGMVVAVGSGSGAREMLDVFRTPAADLLGADGPRYAAAVAIGDGAPVFALGAPLPAREGAARRLAALCRALAAVLDGTGGTLERAALASGPEACITALAAEERPPHTLVRTTARP